MQPWYFNPILAQIGPFRIHWYGLMYGVGFLIAYLWLHYSTMGRSLVDKKGHPISIAAKDSLLIALILGVLLGGRIGYILFYNLPYYAGHLGKIIAVWEGGMSFHGGVLGVGLALWWFCWRYKVAFLKLSDVVTSIAPLGLMFGRIGNFINGELYGKVASGNGFFGKICLNFPSDPTHCRYPTQLLESFLEGLVLFVILWLIGAQIRRKEAGGKEVGMTRTGVVTAFYLLLYGIFRVLIEFVREPDPQIGYIFGFVTAGQILSLGMIVAGGVLMWSLFRSRSR